MNRGSPRRDLRSPSSSAGSWSSPSSCAPVTFQQRLFPSLHLTAASLLHCLVVFGSSFGHTIFALLRTFKTGVGFRQHVFVFGRMRFDPSAVLLDAATPLLACAQGEDYPSSKKDLHPIPITRFRSFRTQPLESLSAAVKLPITKGFWATQPLDKILWGKISRWELGVQAPIRPPSCALVVSRFGGLEGNAANMRAWLWPFVGKHRHLTYGGCRLPRPGGSRNFPGSPSACWFQVSASASPTGRTATCPYKPSWFRQPCHVCPGHAPPFIVFIRSNDGIWMMWI